MFRRRIHINLILNIKKTINKKRNKIMKIDRMNKGEWGKLRAFFDLKTNEGIVIKGFKLVEGINGLFVGMPSQKDKENDENGNPVYRDTVFMEKEARDQVNDLALEEYNNYFGEDIVPYMRSWNSPIGLRTKSFLETSLITKAFATSDICETI